MASSSMSAQELQERQQPLMDQTVAQMRYLAQLQKRSSPPKCPPISILVIVQGFGLVFIGIAIIITANWPGSVSLGANQLKIVGPILLAIGIVIVIIGILLSRYLRKKEDKKWTRKITDMARNASRQMLDQSLTTYSIEKDTNNKQPKPVGESGQVVSKYNSNPYSPTSDEADTSSVRLLANWNEDRADLPQPIRMIKKVNKPKTSYQDQDGNYLIGQNVPAKNRTDQYTNEEEEIGRIGASKNRKNQYTNNSEEEYTTDASTAKIRSGKIPPQVPTKPKMAPPDSPSRLRIKVKALPGTSVNISHSGKNKMDDEDFIVESGDKYKLESSTGYQVEHTTTKRTITKTKTTTGGQQLTDVSWSEFEPVEEGEEEEGRVAGGGGGGQEGGERKKKKKKKRTKSRENISSGETDI